MLSLIHIGLKHNNKNALTGLINKVRALEEVNRI
jgi:hypothetical protein